MKYKLCFYLLLLFTNFISCKNSDQKTATTVATSTDTIRKPAEIDRGYDDSIMADIDRIEIPKQITSDHLFYFSDTAAEDTLRIIIPVGQASKTNTYLQVITDKGRLIYADTFLTNMFIYYSGEEYGLDTAARETMIANRAYFKCHMQALTQPGHEKYQEKLLFKIESKMVLEPEKIDSSLLEMSNVIDEKTLDETLDGSSASFLAVDCFCYEGTSYVGYSARLKKGVVLFAHD